jgi:hypothetical protein
MWYAYNWLMRTAGGLNHQEWLIVLIAVMALGVICLRGFGSRSNY